MDTKKSSSKNERRRKRQPKRKHRRQQPQVHTQARKPVQARVQVRTSIENRRLVPVQVQVPVQMQMQTPLNVPPLCPWRLTIDDFHKLYVSTVIRRRPPSKPTIFDHRKCRNGRVGPQKSKRKRRIIPARATRGVYLPLDTFPLSLRTSSASAAAFLPTVRSICWRRVRSSCRRACRCLA